MLSGKARFVDARVAVPLEAQPHLVRESMQQQDSLTPGSVDLVPLHRNAG